jgi:hypothetical protein
MISCLKSGIPLLPRLFSCTDGVGVFRQPLNQPWRDCFGLVLATKFLQVDALRAQPLLFL